MENSASLPHSLLLVVHAIKAECLPSLTVLVLTLLERNCILPVSPPLLAQRLSPTWATAFLESPRKLGRDFRGYALAVISWVLDFFFRFT
jgi:hypothetical protein